MDAGLLRLGLMRPELLQLTDQPLLELSDYGIITLQVI
jgi:hypothetical protein